MLECTECYCIIDAIDQPHICPCPDEKDEGVVDDWELEEQSFST
jgi:hypothetical protein